MQQDCRKLYRVGKIFKLYIMNISDLKGEYLEVSKEQASSEDSLLKKQNVTGVAVGHKLKDGKETGDVSLTVFVESKMDKGLLSDDEKIPPKVGKYKTDVVESGSIYAGSDITLRNRVRPAEGGYSVGHFRITAGTIATCVKDVNPPLGITSRYYILSNNHVLANSNNALINDPILQPGPADGGTNPADVIARLSRFVPLNFAGGNNLVDCAIAEGNFDDLNREVYWIGYVNGTANPTVGMQLQKTGRTTGHTTQRITAINGTVNVNYGAGRVAKFINQIITPVMGQGGDSGSLMVDMQNRAVGLLFAGSATITIACPIGPVLGSLGIKFL